MSKEDVIALIVQSDDTPSAEMRIVREQTGEHARDRVTETRVEVVEDHLREVVRRVAGFLNRRD